MTVRELIDRLSALSPEAQGLPVVLQLGKNELGNGREARIVEVSHDLCLTPFGFYADPYQDDDTDPRTSVVSITT